MISFLLKNIKPKLKSLSKVSTGVTYALLALWGLHSSSRLLVDNSKKYYSTRTELSALVDPSVDFHALMIGHVDSVTTKNQLSKSTSVCPLSMLLSEISLPLQLHSSLIKLTACILESSRWTFIIYTCMLGQKCLSPLLFCSDPRVLFIALYFFLIPFFFFFFFL